MKRIVATVLVLAALFAFASCNILQELKPYEAEDKVFEKAGLSLTLTEAFEETSYEGYTVCYEALFSAVYVLKEPFSAIEGFENYTIDQYEDLVLQANASKNPTSSTLDGTPVMEYSWENTDLGVTYRYFAIMLKGEDAFWLVQFTCAQEYYEEYKPYFEKWAKTAEV
ncbi:MAG: hypothetical protein J6M12_05770 [Clostridia bacterium]|nr:hypothetical protein [Clostridia bacterium]